MKDSYLRLLRCISCSSPLELSERFPHKSENGNIELGVLTCLNCKANYPIIKGVGVFFPAYLWKHYLNKNEIEICKSLGLEIKGAECLQGKAKKQLSVAERWSYQWNRLYSYSASDLEKQDLYGRDSFFKFIPIEPSDLKGKVIVIWCGGRGREAYHLAKYKPSLIIINEIGDQIYGISEILPGDVELLLIRCDMTNNPLIDSFVDYSICDHALQHVADHNLGFKKMLSVLKTGGIVAVNVYSYENNFVITHLIEPLKNIFHKFSVNGQRWISFIPAMFIYFLIHFIYVPVDKIFGKFKNNLFLSEYMIFRSRDSFKSIWVSCFDLIHAPISYHFKKREIFKLAAENMVSIMQLNHTNGTTWSIVGLKQ
jgi:uncharacterized protein YbaR (Trm112 family)/SAM-dependent methyltransferase